MLAKRRVSTFFSYVFLDARTFAECPHHTSARHRPESIIRVILFACCTFGCQLGGHGRSLVNTWASMSLRLFKERLDDVQWSDTVARPVWRVLGRAGSEISKSRGGHMVDQGTGDPVPMPCVVCRVVRRDYDIRGCL